MPLNGRGFGFAQFEDTRSPADLMNEQVAKVAQQIGEQARQVLAVLRQRLQLAQDRLRVTARMASVIAMIWPCAARPNMESTSLSTIFSPQKLMSWSRADSASRMPPSAASDGLQGRRFNRDTFLLRDFAQVLDDERLGNAPQIEALATRQDRRQHFFRFGRREHELHVGGRLFERFEQRVEGLLGEHVDFVNDVNLEARTGRSVFGGFAQLADFVDAAVAGAVDFENVQRAAFRDLFGALVVFGDLNLGPPVALRHLAKMRAMVVLPVPRGPQKR